MEVSVQRNHNTTIELRAFENLLVGRARQTDIVCKHDIVTAPRELQCCTSRKALVEPASKSARRR